MPATLKRKGSPSLEEDAESPKRRFAEAEPAETEEVDEDDEAAEDNGSASQPTEEDEAATPTIPHPPANDRAARFAALRARNAASRKSNLNDTRAEARRAATDPSQLTALQRKKDIAAHKLLKTDIEAGGEDFERKRAWDWTVEESEKWDERMEEKKRKRDGVKFRDYSDAAGKVYERQLGAMGKLGGGWDERREGYDRQKQEAIDRAVRSGGLEIVETETGELIAVDKDGTYLSTDPTSSTNTFTNRPDKAAVDRLVADIKKAEEVRLKKRRERGRDDGDEGDVTYINEKNKQFNMKLARFYDKYTGEIRDSFERGTAI